MGGWYVDGNEGEQAYNTLQNLHVVLLRFVFVGIPSSL